MKDFQKYKTKKCIFMLAFSALFISLSLFISFKVFADNEDDNVITEFDTYISIEDNTMKNHKGEEKYYLKFDAQKPKKTELYVYGRGAVSSTNYDLLASIAGSNEAKYWDIINGNFVMLDNNATFTFDNVAKYSFYTKAIMDGGQKTTKEKGPYEVYSYDFNVDNLNIIYDEKAHSIQVNIGDKNNFPAEFWDIQVQNTDTIENLYKEPEIYYSLTNPEMTDNPDTKGIEGGWQTENPEFADQGVHKVYYKIKYSYFPTISYSNAGVEKTIAYEEDTEFVGSAYVNIIEKSNPETEGSNYRNSMAHSVSELLAPKEDYPYYDNVYLGSYANGSVSNGVKFRILDRTTNDNFYKGGFLLQSVNNLAISAFGETSTTVANSSLKTMWYSHSYIREAMQNSQNSIYNRAFTNIEKSNIIKTNKTDTTYQIKQETSYMGGGSQSTVQAVSTTDALGSTLRDAYLFPLSAAECFNDNYGFKHPQDSGISNLSADDGPVNTEGNIVTDWWTRSAIYQRQAEVDINGNHVIFKDVGGNGSYNYAPAYASSYLNTGDKNKIYGVRPALNLDVSNVALTSSAGDSEKATPGSKAIALNEKFAQVNEKYSGNEFKLTMYDSSLNIDFNTEKEASYIDSEGKKAAVNGNPPELVATNEHNEIQVPYQGVTLKRNSKDNLYISVLITDYDSGAIKFYGRLQQVKDKEGNLKIILPSALSKGKYKLQFFEEQYNGGTYDQSNLTDYCSEMKEITLIMLKEIDYNIQTQSAGGAAIYNDTVNLYYNGENQSIDGYIQAIAPKDSNGRDEIEVEIEYKNGELISQEPYSRTAPKYKEAGEYPITFRTSVAGKVDDRALYYKPKEKTMTLKILKRPYTFDVADEVQIPYDGHAHSPQIYTGASAGSSAVVIYSENENDLESINSYNDLSGKDNLLIAPSYRDVKRDNDGKVVSNVVYYRILDKNNFYSVQKGSQRVTITPKNITYSAATVELDYDGAEHTVTVKPSDPSPEDTTITYTTYEQDNEQVEGLQYSPTYSDAGEYKIGFKITATNGNYNEAKGTTTLKINKSTIRHTVSDLRAVYNGQYHKIDMNVNIAEKGADSVKAGNSEQTAYAVKYYWDAEHKNEIKDASFKNVMDKTNIYYTITAKNYRDVSGVTTVEIRPSIITYRMDDIANVIYDGDKHGISVSATNVDDNGSKITYSTDGQNYSLVNPRYINAGTYKVYYRIEAKNYETINGNMEFTIHPRLMSAVYIEDIVGRIYTGQEIRPSVVVKDGESNIITEDDYDIVYTDNIHPGTATVSLIGKNNYQGKATKHFLIYTQSSTNSMETANLFSASGGSLLSVPSFGLNFNAQDIQTDTAAEVPMDNMIDFNAEQDTQEISQQDQGTDIKQEEQKDKSAKPKSFRDYIYIIIGVLLLIAAIATVVVLKIRSRKKVNEDSSEEVAQDNLNTETSDSEENEVVDVNDI